MALSSKVKNKENSKLLPLTDFELGVLLERTRSTFARTRELELAQFGLTPEQVAIIHTLQSMGGSATNEELANTIVRQYHSIASIVSRMAKIGLVKKEKVKNKKKFIILLTEKGASRYAQVSRNSIRMFFEDLTPEEKQKLGVILQKMLNKGRQILGLDHRLPFLQEVPTIHN